MGVYESVERFVTPGHGPEEDNSDLSDSDTESDEAGDFNEIHEDAILLHFSETLQEAQRLAVEGNRKRWKEKKWTHYTGNSIRTQRCIVTCWLWAGIPHISPFHHPSIYAWPPRLLELMAHT